MRRFFERLLNLLRIRQPDRDLAREIDAHLALLQDTYEARGLSPDGARRAARLALGKSTPSRRSIGTPGPFAGSKTPGRMPCMGSGCSCAALSSPRPRRCHWRSASARTPRSSPWPTVSSFVRPPASPIHAELVVIGSARGDGGVNPINHATISKSRGARRTLASVFAEELFPHVMGMSSGTENAEAVSWLVRDCRFFRALGAVPFRGRVFTTGDEAAAVLDTTTGGDASTATTRWSAGCCD